MANLQSGISGALDQNLNLNSMCMAFLFALRVPRPMEFQLSSSEYCQAQHK